MGRKENLANKTTTMSTDCETTPALFVQKPNPGDRPPHAEIRGGGWGGGAVVGLIQQDS